MTSTNVSADATSNDRSSLLETLRNISTSDISDAMTRVGLRSVCMWGVLPIKPFLGGRHVAGPAVTVRFLPCHRKEQYQESQYRLTEIVDAAPPGSILVVAAESIGPIPPIQGELNCLTEIRSGLEAHVGATPVRDADQLLQLPIPIFHSQSPSRFGMSSYVGLMYCAGANEPVNCAGALVRPGDVIVGDNNGVVVVPDDYLEQVVEVSLDIVALETTLKEKIMAGVRWKEIYPAEHKRKYVG